MMRYFRTHILVLRKHKHEHPLIYLTEVKFADLQSILDFIYTGETEVAERDLESLLATATRFKVKGLTDSNSAVDGAEPVKKKLKTELVVEDKRSKVINTSPPMKTTITPVYHEAAIIKSEVDGDNNLRGVRSTEPLDISRYGGTINIKTKSRLLSQLSVPGGTTTVRVRGRRPVRLPQDSLQCDRRW